jgi:hypothetical protein
MAIPDQDVTILQQKDRIRMVMQAGRRVTPWRPPDADRRVHRFEKAHIYTPSVYMRNDRVPAQLVGETPPG